MSTPTFRNYIRLQSPNLVYIVGSMPISRTPDTSLKYTKIWVRAVEIRFEIKKKII